MGLPILIAAPTGEASKLVLGEGAGEWVPSEDSKSLSRKVLELADSPERVKQLAQNSYLAASRYSREFQAEKMLKVFDVVAAGQGERIADVLS